MRIAVNSDTHMPKGGRRPPGRCVEPIAGGGDLLRFEHVWL